MRKVFQATDNIGGVEKGLSMSCKKHEEAHQRHRRLVDQSNDGGPHEKIAKEVLYRTHNVNHAERKGSLACDEGVEEARYDPSIGTNVLEDRNSVKR